MERSSWGRRGLLAFLGATLLVLAVQSKTFGATLASEDFGFYLRLWVREWVYLGFGFMGLNYRRGGVLIVPSSLLGSLRLTVVPFRRPAFSAGTLNWGFLGSRNPPMSA